MAGLLRALLVFVLTVMFCATSGVASQYQRQETPHFIVHYHQAEAKLSRSIAAASEKLRERIIADIGHSPMEKTHIILAPTIEDFQRAQPDGRRIPIWAAAVAYPEHNLIILRSPRAVKGGRLDYRSVFLHEYSHVVLGQALKNRDVPRFLAEGIAMYQSSEWHLSRMAVLTRAALTDRIIPLQQLTRGFPDDPAEAELAYAQSFIFISFLINRFGSESFRQFILDYSRSGDLRQALQTLTGMHMLVIEQEWLDYLRLRVSWIPLITSATTIWFLAVLVFIYGYYRKRRKAAITLKVWEEQENMDATDDTMRRH